MVVAIRAMKGSIVAMLNIRKTLIPCGGIFGVVHSQDIRNHLVDYLYMFIGLGVEGS
jgi:hypothetical protein